jgi:hypothetical protein
MGTPGVTRYVLPHRATVDDIKKLTAATDTDLNFVSGITKDTKVEVITGIIVPGHETPVILQVLLTIEGGVNILATGEAYDVGLVDVSDTLEASTVEHTHIVEGTRSMDIDLIVTPIELGYKTNGQRVSPVR